MTLPSGFHETVMSVFEIDRIADPLVRIGGWVRQDLPDASAGQTRFWGAPFDCTRIEQTLLTAPGRTDGALRLIRFETSQPQRLIRPAQHVWDTGGLFDIDVYVTDIEHIYQGFLRCGWTAFGPPTEYSWGGFHVSEALVLGPDGLVIALIQPFGPVFIDLPPILGMSRAFNASQVVRSYDTAMDFYLKGLGWTALVDSLVDDAVEPGQNILGLPMPMARTTRRRVSIVTPTGQNNGSVELIELADIAGHDFAAHAHAPNIGLYCHQFFVDDARAYADDITSRGISLLTAPTEMEIAPHGRVLGFSVASPDKARLDFLQRL
jgi:predicted enzyme related to lactoylglutathione lyase